MKDDIKRGDLVEVFGGAAQAAGEIVGGWTPGLVATSQVRGVGAIRQTLVLVEGSLRWCWTDNVRPVLEEKR